MEKFLDARFERVEKALTTLIDSIAKYNPSEKLAEDLTTADKELTQGLCELEHHQNNSARISQLRQETTALDTQTKEIIGTLWSMRKEVKNTTTTTYPSGTPKYEFTTSDLLGYARRISRNTLPPPGVTNGVDFGASPPPAQDLPAIEEAGPSGTQTPNASFNNGVGTPSANGEVLASQVTITSTVGDMPLEIKAAANPGDGALFFPWPIEEDVRFGGLAAYQALSDNGIDPKGYDPEEEEKRKREEEQARLEEEERARQEREEADRRMRQERERMARERERDRQEAERRGSVAGGSARPQPKQQFAFLDLDDDDDDE